MKNQTLLTLALLTVVLALPLRAGAAEAAKTESAKPAASEDTANQYLEQRHESHGSVVIGGKRIDYDAVAGTIMIEDSKGAPGALMSYVAYFKSGLGGGPARPLTFFYNGGPGSATLWLHIGAFGPKRVEVGNGVRGAPAPYPFVDNGSSLLDATDLVFIDAPGTGFGRVGVDLEKIGEEDKRNKAREHNDELKKEFYGIDQDARAFDIFITKFLSRFNRWNSPRFLFGESYGTTRSAVLSFVLQSRSDIDLNGVMLLSQIFNFGLSPDGPQSDPGNDLPYMLSLPTYAATAWYHKKVPSEPAELAPFIDGVEQFALSDYARALAAGDRLSEQDRQTIAAKLHDFTGLPVAYILKANLRIDGGMFEKNLMADEGLTVGRLDTRYTSPSIDPLAKEAEYDPQSAAIDSAFVSVYNDYARSVLGFPREAPYMPESDDINNTWDFRHKEPGDEHPEQVAVNVMPDLATVMKMNPRLKVAQFAGYYDLATPFFAAEYEMNHLGLPPQLAKNIEFYHFDAGHMVYVSPQALEQLHDQAAAFIRANSK
ncbi:MAG TPA: hypothetical protein VMU67_04440 [Steroidobacteraceae bacterium]|nr:hypothetical protein [Steroidobacteraceae bacterium]